VSGPILAAAPITPEEPETLTVLTVDDFAALEERIVRAVSLVRREREARVAAEERLLLLESQVLAHAPELEQLQQEVASLRTEREQVRQRVERLLGQLDALEL
jgi:chromosome segregation ATPase